MALVDTDKPTLAEAQSFIPDLPFTNEAAMNKWLDNSFFELKLEFPNATSAEGTLELFKRAIAHRMMCDYYSNPVNKVANTNQQVAGSKGLGSDVRYFKDDSANNTVTPSEFHCSKATEFWKAAGVITTSSSVFVGVQV